MGICSFSDKICRIYNVLINAIFLILGFVLIAAGATAMTILKDFFDSGLLPKNALVAVIAVGGLIVLIAVLGCVAACKEYRCADICNLVVTLLMCIAIGGMGAVVLTMGTNFTEIIRTAADDNNTDVGIFMCESYMSCCIETTTDKGAANLGHANDPPPKCTASDTYAELCPGSDGDVYPEDFLPTGKSCHGYTAYKDGVNDWATSKINTVAYGVFGTAGIFFMAFIGAIFDVCNDSTSGSVIPGDGVGAGTYVE